MFTWLTYRILVYIAGALGIAVVVLLAILWAAGVRIDAVKNQRDAAELRVTEALKTIAGQRAALAECSDRTDKLAAEGVKRAGEAAKAVATAQAEARKYEQTSKRLRALSVAPTPSGADCRHAIAEARRDLRP